MVRCGLERRGRFASIGVEAVPHRSRINWYVFFVELGREGRVWPYPHVTRFFSFFCTLSLLLYIDLITI